MKIGQSVYAGSARLEGRISNLTETHATVKIGQNGHHVKLPREAVKLRRQRDFKIGDVVRVSIYGIGSPLDGEVVGLRPVKARIRTPDPIWFGAVVCDEDAIISKGI